MDNIVITIARQYGSGGNEIGEMLADELGIHFYNREIMRLASDDSGINEDLFLEADEKLKGSTLFKISKSVYDGELIPPDSNDFVSTRNLFNYQAKVIKKLAETEPCVIVGRCADFILRDYFNVMSVFLHASPDFCMKRSRKRMGLTGRSLEKYVHKTEKYRGDYYKHYTGNDWRDARNYDLCLDSEKLGFEKCKNMILTYRKTRFEV